MITGQYRIYKDGELYAVAPNVITTEGRKMITRYLAGSISSWAGSIAVGTDATAAAVGNTQLGFEFGRADIELRSARLDTNQVIFRTALPDSLSGFVYEMGVFNLPSNHMTGYPRRVLTTFNSTIENVTGGTESGPGTAATPLFGRAGVYTRNVTPAASATADVYIRNLTLNLSGYRDSDTFTLALNPQTTNTASVAVRFQADDANYYSGTFTVGAVTGYRLISVAKSAFTKTGTVDWSTIKEIRVITTSAAGGASNLYLDALSVDDKTTYPEYTLVSRAVLGTPLFKGFNEQLDVEYAVDVV